MKCQILHRSRGRLRVRMAVPRMTLGDADALEYYLRDIPGVTEVQVFDRTRDAVILFSGDEEPVLRGLGQRPDRRQAGKKALIVAPDRLHAGLLQHDLRKPHMVGFPVAPPGQIAAVGGKPRKQQLRQALKNQFVFPSRHAFSGGAAQVTSFSFPP